MMESPIMPTTLFQAGEPTVQSGASADNDVSFASAVIAAAVSYIASIVRRFAANR